MIESPVGHKIPYAVQVVFETFPSAARARLLDIRALIYMLAAQSESIGTIVETLKWGEPAYLTERPKSGTTIRLAWKEKVPDNISLFVSCQTRLVEDWRHLYEDRLELIGNRELRLDIAKALPLSELEHCISMALLYHVREAA